MEINFPSAVDDVMSTFFVSKRHLGIVPLLRCLHWFSGNSPKTKEKLTTNENVFKTFV